MAATSWAKRHQSPDQHYLRLYKIKGKGSERSPVLRNSLCNHSTYAAYIWVRNQTGSMHVGFMEALLHMLLHAYSRTLHRRKGAGGLPVLQIVGLSGTNAVTAPTAFSKAAAAASGRVGGRINSTANIAGYHAGAGQAGSVQQGLKGGKQKADRLRQRISRMWAARSLPVAVPLQTRCALLQNAASLLQVRHSQKAAGRQCSTDSRL